MVPEHLRVVADSVVTEAAKDPRVLAVLAGGSVATGTSDEYSDLRKLRDSDGDGDRGGVQVIRRTAAEEAFVDFLE